MSESYAVSEKRELLLDKVKKFILDVCRAGDFGAWSDRNTAFQCDSPDF